MAWNHVGAVLEASHSRAPDRFVAVAVAHHMNQASGSAWPAVSTIARECNLSERFVQYALRRLEASGELVLVEPSGPGGKRVYRLGARLSEEAAKLADDARRGVHVYAPGGAQICTPGAQIRAPERELNENGTSVTEGDVDKSKAQQIGKRLRTAGIRNARATPQLVSLVKLGASFEDVLAAIQGAQGAAGDPFAYGVTVLLNRMRTAPQAGGDQGGWENAPRSVVESKGVELGVGKWEEGREHWPQYKQRVTDADKRRAAA